MQTSTKAPATPTRLQILLKTLSQAINRVERKLDIQDGLEEANLLLETLPLSTDEFGLARNRLWNAGRFVRSGEYGAANWELRTLRNFFLRPGLEDAAKSRSACWTG